MRCTEAVSLVRSTWMLIDAAASSSVVDPNLEFHVPLFIERLRAVREFDGELLDQLAIANPYPATVAGIVGASFIELALKIAERVYRILLEAESGAVAARRLIRSDGFRDLDIKKLEANWNAACELLAELHEFDYWLFEENVTKEFQRAKPPAAGGDMLASLTPKPIGELLNVSLQPPEITFQGKVFVVEPDHALAFDAMVKSYPERMSLAQSIGVHPERKMKRLPSELLPLVDTTKKGSRLNLS